MVFLRSKLTWLYNQKQVSGIVSALAYKKKKRKKEITTTVKTFQFERGVPVGFCLFDQPMTQLLDGALYQKIRRESNGLRLDGRKKQKLSI